MQLAFAFSLFCALATLIAATVIGPNAARIRAGLPPLPPRQPFSPTAVDAAKRHAPSGKPSACSTGPIQCCESFESATNPLAELAALAVGAEKLLHPGIEVGLVCGSLSGHGILGNLCFAHALCCKDTSFHGVISIDCTPVAPTWII